MKKLNRKGFTLIELLAIIVILAIIMVVTIPTILNATETATEKQLKNAADSIEKWVSDQYVLAGVSAADANFTTVCGAVGDDCETEVDIKTKTGADAFLKAAGVLPTDFSSVKITIDNTTKRVCVKVTASDTGSFSSVKGTTKNSNGC